MFIFVVHNITNNMSNIIKIRLQHGWGNGKPPTCLPIGSDVVQTVAVPDNSFDQCTTSQKRLNAY